MHKDFLQTIAKSPYDEAPKKIYADWLDENGYHDEAALYRNWKTANKAIDKRLDDYDWAKAFEYAGEVPTEEYCRADGQPSVKPASPLMDVSTSNFSRCDVIEIIALHVGANDEDNWLCVGRLFDGRWFALDAGCDYTGWD